MTKNPFSRIYQIDHDQPGLSVDTWANLQPVWRFSVGGRDWVLNQPSSTFWVYALGVLTCVVAAGFGQHAAGNPAMFYWSVGLWLWGIGALLAGTSYQAAGYHLKCRDGRVRWTNWWEAIYMICQQLSVNALLAAAAYSSADGALRTAMLSVALATSIIYTLITLIAAFVPNRRLLSFEWMAWVCTPSVLFMLLLHTVNAVMTGALIEWALAGVWLGLILSMLAFLVYMRAGLTEKLWLQKRWFSENDVLHVTLITWALYLLFLIEPIRTYTM